MTNKEAQISEENNASLSPDPPLIETFAPEPALIAPTSSASARQPPRAKLTEGPIATTVLGLAGPMVFGILSIMLMNLIDTYFVGKLGTAQLAAISFTFPVVAFVGSIALGLAAGTTSVVSRAIGAGRWEEVQKLTTHAMLLSMLVVACFAVVGLLTIDPLFRALGAKESALPWIHDYMVIWYIGVVFLVVPMVGNGAIRASGDTRTPAVVMFFAALVNIVLDPIFIFGWGPIPRMEMAGAALTTIFSRALTLLVALWVLSRREKMLDFSSRCLQGIFASWRAVLAIGLPSAATQIATPLSLGILTGMLAGYGKETVAAFGAGGRLEMLFLMVPMAVSAALAPFVGQNWGAQRKDRVTGALRFSFMLSLVGGTLAYLVIFVMADPIARFFSNDPKVVPWITRYLWIVAFGYPLTGVVMACSATFNATNQPMKAAALALLRMPILSLPLAWLGMNWFGPQGVFWALALAQIITGMVALYVSIPLWKKTIHPPSAPPTASATTPKEEPMQRVR
ncbi:MATE family efflux transporter [Myxococcota bacterium]|nr:MATE family efflux transporter [Myxococcota bacterium]